MIETVLAVFGITLLFLALFKLTSMMKTKIMLEHAAMRVARARAVGCNDFQCLKAARVAVIPAAGERLWPDKHDERTKNISESALARMYMRTLDSSYARGLLHYDGWETLEVETDGDGLSKTHMTTRRRSDENEEWKVDWFSLDGEATVDRFPIYMNNMGL